LVLDDQINQYVAHVEDEAQDGVVEIQPHVSFKPVGDPPHCSEDEGQAKQAKGRIERLGGKVDVEPKGWDLENDVACGSGYVEDVLHEVEEQDYLNPERQGAPTAELV